MPYKDPNSKEAKESRKRSAKRYYEKNKELIAKKNKTDPRRIKDLRINNWVRRGVKGDLNELYEYYMNCKKCENEKCNHIFKDTIINSNKCLDHDHNTGEFRKVLCRDCNNWDRAYKEKK